MKNKNEEKIESDEEEDGEEDNRTRAEKTQDKKDEFRGMVFKVGKYKVFTDRMQFIFQYENEIKHSYFGTMGLAIDHIFNLECRKNLVSNKNKEDLLEIKKAIEKAEKFILEVVEPLLNTDSYKHLIGRCKPVSELDLDSR
jgi:hypothetical protein